MIQLGKKINYLVGRSIEISEFRIGTLIDDITNRVAKVNISVPVNKNANGDVLQWDSFQITLWNGNEYDLAGQYTDNDIKERIIKILNNI